MLNASNNNHEIHENYEKAREVEQVQEEPHGTVRTERRSLSHFRSLSLLSAFDFVFFVSFVVNNPSGGSRDAGLQNRTILGVFSAVILARRASKSTGPVRSAASSGPDAVGPESGERPPAPGSFVGIGSPTYNGSRPRGGS
jgi:hypothetical protein